MYLFVWPTLIKGGIHNISAKLLACTNFFMVKPYFSCTIKHNYYAPAVVITVSIILKTGFQVDLYQDIETEGEKDEAAATGKDASATSSKSMEPSCQEVKTKSARACKNKSSPMANEAYAVMKGLLSEKKDEFDIYGENVAVSLRNLNRRAATYAKFEISRIRMLRYHIDTRTKYTCLLYTSRCV